MYDRLPEVINYVIGAALLVFILFFLRAKRVEQPELKIFGFSLRTIITMIYVAIAIDVILIIAILLGWVTT